MRPYNSSPSPLGEGGIHMPFQTQHHHHHHHYHHYHHHYHHQQPQQQQQFQAAQRHINNNNVNHHYLQHQPQPQQIQQQQQINHHHYYSQAQYQAMRAPNGAPTTAIKQTAIYPPQDLGPQAPYYNYTQHYHHQQQHHLAQQQWRAQSVVYGNAAAAAAGRGGGYPQYSPSFLNVEYPAPQQTFYRDSHHGGDGRGLTNTHGGFNANSEKDSRESYFAVHFKSFAELEEVKRRNSIRESLDQAVYAKMKRRPYAGILKIFLIVERHYLAACMSIPQSEDDVILSKEVAMEFLDVAHVYCDDGDRLVELEDGAHVAKHVYSTLRCALSQLAVYEESKLNNADFEVNFFDSASFSAEKLLMKDIVANHAVSTSLFHALEKDDDAADALWRRLLLEPSTASSTNTTSSNTTAAAATSTDGIDSVAQLQQQQNVNASSGKGNGSLLLLSSSEVGILSTVQGIRLFRKAVRHPKRRETLFHVLKEAAAPPPPPPPSEENSESQPLLPFMPEQLFLTLFSSSLTSWFVFECFGLVEGSFRCEEEVNVICAALERLALKVVCNNGGSFLMTALVKALCPSQFHDGEKVGGKRGRSSESRGRQEEKRGEQQVEVGNDESYSHNNNNGNKNENNGNSNRDMAKSGGGGADEEAPPGTTTMSDLRISEMTSDWRLFYAVARAFVAGPIPGKASSGEAMLTCRVKLLTQHVVACRAIQRFIPFFAATVIQGQKNMKQKEEKKEERGGEQEANKQIPSPEREQFYDDCGKILTEIANQSGLLANHSYGNYVLQTVISELAECAIPGSLIEEMLRKVFDTLTETIFHVCVQKFASNCVETAIKACHKLPNANSLVLRFATALLSQGPDRMLQVAMQQFGNYAVRRILLSLTDIATADSQTATVAEVEEARALERQYFSYLNDKLEQLRQTAYGTGVLAWVQNQRERLQAAE